MLIPSFYNRLSARQQLLLQISIGLAFVLLYISPFLILGEKTPVKIFDNIDQGPTQWWQIYHETNPFWNSSIASPRFLNGAALPAHAGPNFQWDSLPYYLFPPFSAYVLLQFLTRIVAFVGMWLLLCSLFRKGEKQGVNVLISTGVAVLFSILPHYPPTSFTVPALPFLAWVLLTIARHEDYWWHWTTLCLLPFFTDFLMAPVFLLILAGMWWMIDAIARHKGNWRGFGALTLVTILYCISQYQLVLCAITSQEISQRIEFKAVPASLKETCFVAWSDFIHGQALHHVDTHHKYLIPIFILTIWLALSDWGRILAQWFWAGRKCTIKNAIPRVRNERNYYLGMTVGAFVLAGIIALVYGFYTWAPVVSLRQSVPVLNMVQWNRFNWLHPLVWYVGLASLLLAWTKILRPRYGIVFIASVLLLQGVTLFWHADYTQTWRKNEPTWREFFATEQFKEMREFIGKPTKDYRVASIGMHPSIALYNGFYCMDGYCANYNLAYKKKFRQVIAPELAKDQNLERYFNNSGIRCYLFSAELGKNYVQTKQKNKSISGIALGLDAFKKLGGEYIFSAVHVDNPDKSGLKLVKVFEHPQSAWTIWLYAPL